MSPHLVLLHLNLSLPCLLHALLHKAVFWTDDLHLKVSKEININQTWELKLSSSLRS